MSEEPIHKAVLIPLGKEIIEAHELGMSITDYCARTLGGRVQPQNDRDLTAPDRHRDHSHDWGLAA